MQDQLIEFVNKVKCNHPKCDGNEASTKSSLIAPLFPILGWDLTNPDECHPEYRADINGRGDRFNTPVDWAFGPLAGLSFLVEAKHCGVELDSCARQLAMYFSQSRVSLGIYTNGTIWQFYADLDFAGRLDERPFLTWNILEDDPIPMDFLTLLQKSNFNAQNIKTFADRGRKQNSLVERLNQLLLPASDEFIRQAIGGDARHQPIERRQLRENVITEWKPIVIEAIKEWVRLTSLQEVLDKTTAAAPPGPAEGGRRFVGRTCPNCNKTGMGYRTRRCPQCNHDFQGQPATLPMAEEVG